LNWEEKRSFREAIDCRICSRNFSTAEFAVAFTCVDFDVLLDATTTLDAEQHMFPFMACEAK
jgi:hypothetical protein